MVLQKEMKELKGYAQVERRAKKSYLPDPATDETLQFVEELNLRRKRLAMKLLRTYTRLATIHFKQTRYYNPIHSNLIILLHSLQISSLFCSLCDETLQIVEDLRTKDLRKKRQSFYDYANCGNYGNGNL